MHLAGIVLCFSVVLASCTSLKKYPNREPSSTYYVDPQYGDFQKLLSESLTFRSTALKFIEAKKMHETDKISLTRNEGEYVRSKGAEYLILREKLLKIAGAQRQYFAETNRVQLVPGKGTRSENAPTQDGVYVAPKMYFVDPMDFEGRKSIFEIQMGLAAALMLMDNYILTVAPFNENSNLRYVLNYDVEKRGAIQEIATSHASVSHREQVVKAIEFIDSVMEWRRKQGVATSLEEAQLYEMTQSSLWYLSVKNGKASNTIKDYVENVVGAMRGKGKRGLRIASYGLSLGFGNMVGLVETRKGHLSNMSESERAALTASMKPLDILMEKTPFRLTDKMIPGHYGHVAIWLGTERQLKDLDVWNQIPERIQKQIQAGHAIVEALRPGVEINTLDHFLNIDDFLVLRDIRPQISNEYRRKAILQAVSQIGKKYDFNFDVHTHERIVCSEIAYVVYSDIKWPLENTVRRYTISPDNVAQLALPQPPVGGSPSFEPVIMYYRGQRIDKSLPYSLSLLLKADDKSYAEFEKLHNMWVKQ